VNAVIAANERVPVQTAIPKSLLDAGSLAPPEAESTVSIETLQARAETVTAVLENILGSESMRAWRRQ